MPAETDPVGAAAADRRRRVAMAARALRSGLAIESVSAAIIVGSGFAAGLPAVQEPVLLYDKVTGLPRCGVTGHAGEAWVVHRDEQAVLVLSGRFHGYEGHVPGDVVFPVDLAAALGAHSMLLTCAAGGVREDLRAGTLVAIEDHLNLVGWTPPLAPVDFLDLSAVYDAGLRAALARRAAECGVDLATGVLACLPGPAYETPAEVRMLRRLGADLVSMSTVPEAIRARALGLRVAALACVSNPAASDGETMIAHREVVARVAQVAAARAEFLERALQSVAVAAG
ncbi:MAG: purine-nucleoside phosphorylase [Acidobacteriota bacterium]